MVYKVDGGGVSNTRREEPVIKKTEVKPAYIRNETPQTNAAVYTNRIDNTNQANVLRFKLNAQFTAPVRQTTPTITPQEAAQCADEIIANNGGKDNLNTEGVGQDLADIAGTNPADVRAITEAMLGDSINQDDKGKIKEADKDEIAQSFTDNLTDAEIDAVASDDNGRALLERMQRHLLSGSVHGDEIDTASESHR